MRSTRTTIRRRLGRRRPNLGMILAVVALLAALGGTAVAGGGFLTTKKFKKQAVRGPVVYSVTTTTIPNPGTGDQYITVSANCPPGTKVIGGGIKIPDPTVSGNAYQNDSYATSTGWAGHVSNYTSGGGSTTATTIAVCVTVKSSIGSPPAS
jgi:hypothetical protein